MQAGRLKDSRLRDGEELKTALCTACESNAPQKFDNAMLNKLLDFASLPRDDPRRDPLELKQELAAVDAGLGALKMKQKRAVVAACEAQINSARRCSIPERFYVEGGWPPKEPEPEPPRAAPTPSTQLIVSPTPLSGEGDGFTWTQTETELTLTIPVPDGTQKNEVMMQCTPKFGPCQHIVMRARFWPLPIIVGHLHHPIEASEACWHLDTNCKVMLDLPKVEEKLWQGSPPVFSMGAGPLSHFAMPAVGDEEAESTGSEAPESTTLVTLATGVAVESIVQKMGQAPAQLEMQMRGCAALAEALEADPGKSLAAANARAVPVLLRVLRTYGQATDVQHAVWRPLLLLLHHQPFLRKLVIDAGGMRMLLAGLDAHKRSETVLTQLGLALRALLPSTPPRPFVESGGLELLVESVNAFPSSAPLCEVVGSCLHMLSAVNNIVRRMILRMEIVPTLLAACEAHQTRLSLHEVVVGLLVQLGRGDASCVQLYCIQLKSAGLLRLMGRFPASAEVQADVCRALGVIVTSEAATIELIEAGGLEQLLAASEAHAGESAVTNEVINVLEQAVCAMCDEIDEDAPDEEYDAAGMAELLRSMVEDARARKRKAEEDRRRAEEEAREAAEEAERVRRANESAEAKRVAEVEAAPTAYGGFSWGASAEGARLDDGEDDVDGPRIVELDDD